MPAAYQLSPAQQNLVADVEEAFKLARDAKADVFRKQLEWYKIYNAYVPRPKTVDEKKRARIASVQGFSAVEHATAKLRGIIIPSQETQPIIRAIPQEEQDQARQNVVENVVNFDLRKARIRYKAAIWLRNLHMFGVAPVYPYWRYQVKTRLIRPPIDIQDPITGQWFRYGLGDLEPIDTVLFNGPDFDVGDIEDFFPDPAAMEFTNDGMRWVVRRYYRSYNTLALDVSSNPEMWDQEVFSLLKPDEPPPVRYDDDSFEQEIIRYHQWPIDINRTSNAAKGVVEIIEWMSADRIISIANRRLPIRNVDNPYWHGQIPCIVATRLPKTNYPWGKGLLEPIEKTIAHLNAMRNARLDTINLNINPPWKIQKGMVPDKTQLKTLPNSYIEVLNMKGLEKVEIPDYTASSYIEEDRMRQDVESATNQTGIAETLAASPNVRSASQQFGIMDIIAERTQMDVDDFAVTGLEPLAYHFFSLRQQFQTTETTIRIAGEDGYLYPVVSPTDLIGAYDFHLVASAKTLPKAIEAQQKLQFLSGLAPMFVGFEDLMLKLIYQFTKELGYFDISKELKQIIFEMALIRYAQGGILNRNPKQEGEGGKEGNGKAKQKAQGPRGNEGKNTVPRNTPGFENIINSFINNLSPPDIRMEG